uniref:E3 ubiquitin-protein ligase Topors n=1 Tax=Myripristis murdjan TaxID=586833 RepID=A0A667Y879_9TELE
MEIKQVQSSLTMRIAEKKKQQLQYLSPDSKCPICLDTFSNISYLDLCLHKFCFRCIHEWSKNKAECPLCKQPFNSIYHSIKSEQEFKKYDLQPLENGSFGTFGGARFRYRTTLTGVQRQTQRRTSTPPDSGVMFEGSANPPQQRRDRSLRVRSVRDGELMVLYGAHGSLEELRPFLQGRAEHFLHEFISFAKSPFNMEAYDQHAVYDCPAPSSNEDSSSNSSVIAISEDEQNSVELDPPGNSMSALSHSAWDDETPGPSYSTTEESRVHPYNQTDSFQVKNDECLSSDNDDCVIVGFVKPTAERTPELVQLSSDSENSDHEETLEVPQLPQHIRFTSLSPPTSPSRAPSGAGRSESREGECHHSGSKERYSPSTLRHKPSSKSDRRTRDCHERDSRRYHSGDRSKKRHGSRNRDRKRRRSRSQECSRSPVTLSRSRRRSRSRSRDRSYSRWDSDDKRRDYGFSRNSQLYSYHLQSYNCHGQERDDSRAHYTEKRSYYFSCHKNSDRRSYSRSRSRSGECHRKSRRHSRSRTDSSSCSPSTRRRSHHDKPAGKRKYKTRHLEETANSSPYKSYPGPDSSTSLTKEHKKSKEKHHKKSKEKSRRRSRSLSVEIVYEDSSSKHSKRHHKKKKKHKKKSKRHKSKERTGRQSPTVITIDSDGDYFVDDSITQASSANKDNSINNTADNLADSTHLDSVVQAGNQISTAVAGKDVSEMDLVPDDHHGLLS